MTNTTIYALSTVFGKSGVAVIRVSGENVLNIISKLTDIDINNIKPRYAYFSNIRDIKTELAYKPQNIRNASGNVLQTKLQ